MRYVILFLMLGLMAPMAVQAQKPSALGKLPKEKFTGSNPGGKPSKPSHRDKLKSLGGHRSPDEIENPKVGEAIADLENGDVSGAIDQLDDYSETDADAAFGLGVAQYENGDNDAAIEALSKALELEAGNTDARYVLGLVYAEQGNYNEAEEEFLQILEADPQDADTWYQLGKIYHAAGFEEEAQVCLAAVLEIDPNYPDAQY